jgi:signal transduction histidine kinase
MILVDTSVWVRFLGGNIDELWSAFLSAGSQSGEFVLSLGDQRVILEVTAQRRAEAEARDANERRQRLMAIVSHDLRNPLSAIMTAAGLIGMNGEAPREVLGLASRVANASLRMRRLIEQLLDFVRVDQAGGIGLEPNPMDLAAAARHVGDEVGLASPNAVVQIVANGNTVGEWDEDRLLQVLSNLLSNAVQHG